MIDWLGVGWGALWIMGLSIGLAAVSLANYQSSLEKRKLWQVLGSSTFQFVLDVGMIFFCIGLVGSVDVSWERMGWGILAVAFGIQAWMTRRRAKD